MVEKKKSEQKVSGNTYILYAIGSAVFAALTSILAKVGITGVESNLGTAIRTIVVLVMAWLLVLIKKKNTSAKAARQKGAWLYRIIRDCHRCILAVLLLRYSEWHSQRSCAIDKMSLLVTVIFSYFAFHEKLSKKAFFGLILMLVGTLAMAISHN